MQLCFVLIFWPGFDFSAGRRRFKRRMKPARAICLWIVVAVGILAAGSVASAGTTWGYVPTNAFTSLIFSNPTCITSPPGETNRLFIVEKHGRIVVITNLASPTRTIFMDLAGKVSVVTASESGDF